eukprot:293177_1
MTQCKVLNLFPKKQLLQNHYFSAQQQHYKEQLCAISEEDDLWLNYDKFACNHICVKELDELKEVNITDLNIGINYGVKLIAKTIVNPRGLINISTILEDKNNNAISIAIYNYQQILQNDSMLPENTKLIIKEPYIKIFQNQNPAIRIDNPFTNIILFHDTLKPIIINTNKESINTLSIHALKEIGNKYFKSKQYKAAVKCYSVALTKNDQDNKYQDLICKLLNNRALCYIQLKNFQKAAKDANKALSMNDSWLKAKYTLCNALIGNKRYKEALNYLKGANLNKHKAFKTLTKTINRKILETSKEFVYDKPKTMQLWEPEIDFVSDSIEVVWINKKKGRGFVAVKDIKKGQLLVRETCFAMGYPVKNWSNYPLKKKQTHFEQN